jgi:hypothetical protein
MGDKISSEQTFSTKAGEIKTSCLTKLASPSLDFSIALDKCPRFAADFYFFYLLSFVVVSYLFSLSPLASVGLVHIK